jgi:hypothetical protein
MSSSHIAIRLASKNLSDVNSSINGYIGAWNDTHSCVEFNVPHQVHDVRGDFVALGNLLNDVTSVCHTWQLYTQSCMNIDEKNASCLHLVPKHIIYSASSIAFAPFHQDHSCTAATQSQSLALALAQSADACAGTGVGSNISSTNLNHNTNDSVVAVVSRAQSATPHFTLNVNTGEPLAQYGSGSMLDVTRGAILAPRGDGREIIVQCYGPCSTSIVRCQPPAGVYGRPKLVQLNSIAYIPTCVAISSCGNVAAVGSPNRIAIWRTLTSDPLHWGDCESCYQLRSSDSDANEDSDDNTDIGWCTTESFATCLAFSADGTILAIGEASGKVTLLSIDVARPNFPADADTKLTSTKSDPVVRTLTSINAGYGTIAAIDISNNSNTASTFQVACVARSGATVIARVRRRPECTVQILHSQDCEDLIDEDYEATSISFSKCNSRFIVGITHDMTQHISGKVRIYNCRFISDMMLALLIGFVSKTQPCADPDAPIMRLRKSKLLDVRAIAMVRSYLS